MVVENRNELKMFDNCPKELNEFISKSKRLRSALEPQFYGATRREELNVSKESSLRVSPKKQHEIETLVPFVKELCERNGCKCVIDIGSGLVSLFFYLFNEKNIISF